MASPRHQRPPHPAWSSRSDKATAVPEEKPATDAALSMANSKAELVQAAVDYGWDQAEVEAMTKAEILELIGAG